MTLKYVQGVPVVHWNPRRNQFPRPFRRLPLGRRIENFGDLLGPLLIDRIVASEGLSGVPEKSRPRRVVAIGSILHLARGNDYVWGTGVNAKVSGDAAYDLSELEITAVRGPRTRDWLAEHGIEAPAVYGDPALLLPMYCPEFGGLSENKTRKLAIVPNFHEVGHYEDHPDFVDPRGDLIDVISKIVSSETVVGSSLHGIVVAEAWGVPSALIRSRVEPPTKYLDYYEGTNRTDVRVAENLAEGITLAVDREGEEVLENWNRSALIEAFPRGNWA